MGPGRGWQGWCRCQPSVRTPSGRGHLSPEGAAREVGPAAVSPERHRPEPSLERLRLEPSPERRHPDQRRRSRVGSNLPARHLTFRDYQLRRQRREDRSTYPQRRAPPRINTRSRRRSRLALSARSTFSARKPSPTPTPAPRAAASHKVPSWGSSPRRVPCRCRPPRGASSCCWRGGTYSG